MLCVRLWDKNYTLRISVLVLTCNLSSISIADLLAGLCVAETVMWMSVCQNMFVGGKKIYVLCFKNISNTGSFPALVRSVAGATSRNK